MTSTEVKRLREHATCSEFGVWVGCLPWIGHAGVDAVMWYRGSRDRLLNLTDEQMRMFMLFVAEAESK